jgi:hypothetical protein
VFELTMFFFIYAVFGYCVVKVADLAEKKEADTKNKTVAKKSPGKKKNVVKNRAAVKRAPGKKKAPTKKKAAVKKPVTKKKTAS